MPLEMHSPNDETKMEYDLFVSYSKADNEFVQKLVKRIESEQYRGRNLRCFYAEWDVMPGENIVLKLESGLTKSRFVGLVMSPDWEKSNWATLERVVPVYEDPAGYKGRTLPILRQPCEIPASIKILKWYNFQNDRNFEKEARRLISRLRGESLRAPDASQHNHAMTNVVTDATQPDYQIETLASNLFPVTQLPSTVYVARPTVERRNDVFDKLGENVALPAFVFHEDPHEMFSFSSFNDATNLLSQLVNDPRSISVAGLLGGDASVLIELLNRTMTAHMRGLGMIYDWNNKKTFFPTLESGQTRLANWRVGNRTFERTLVRPPRGPSPYFAHRSCKATFTSFEGNLYLKVLPGWHFTNDGVETAVDPQRMGSLSARWMNRERNHSVLDDLRFWVYTLSRGSASIVLDTGAGTSAVISCIPLFAQLDRGLEDDYRERLWLEEEPEIESTTESNVEDPNEQDI